MAVIENLEYLIDFKCFSCGGKFSHGKALKISGSGFDLCLHKSCASDLRFLINQDLRSITNPEAQIVRKSSL